MTTSFLSKEAALSPRRLILTAAVEVVDTPLMAVDQFIIAREVEANESAAFGFALDHGCGLAFVYEPRLRIADQFRASSQKDRKDGADLVGYVPQRVVQGVVHNSSLLHRDGFGCGPHPGAHTS
jgi:hypothetical protein